MEPSLRSGPCGRGSRRRTSTSVRSAMPSAFFTAATLARSIGLVAFSRPMVVGSVGRPSMRRFAHLDQAGGEPLVVGLDRRGEAAVRLGVFVAAIDAGRLRQGGEAGEALPHLRRRPLEEAAAAEREQRVAAEECVLDHIGDVAERVAGHGDHRDGDVAEADRLAVADGGRRPEAHGRGRGRRPTRVTRAPKASFSTGIASTWS